MDPKDVRGFARLNRHSNYSIGKIRTLVDAHSYALENLKGEDGVSRHFNSEKSWTFFEDSSSASSCEWNGTVKDFYGNVICTVDFVGDETMSRAEKIKANLKGKYLVFDTSPAGTDYAPADTVGDAFGTNSKFWFAKTSNSATRPFMEWEVGAAYQQNGETFYRLKQNADAAGTIRIPIPIPTENYMVVQQGRNHATEGETDRGVVSNYLRAH